MTDQSPLREPHRAVLAAGMRVVSSPNWPREPSGTESFKFPAHPIVVWFARWLPITPYVAAEYIKYQDAAMIVAHGHIFCSERQRRALMEITCEPE